MTWRHDDLLASLAAHLRGNPRRMVWCDMPMGPSGSQRPDVWTLNRSFADPRPMAYECKVSVSDFRADVTAGKWQGYLKFSMGVVFAMPKGLIDKADLPQRCGLMVLGDKGWKTLKAPTLWPVALPQDVLLKLLIDGLDRLHIAAGRQANSYLAERAALAAIGKRYGARVAAYLKDADAAERDVTYRQEEGKRTRARAERAAEETRAEAERAWDDLCDVLGLERGERGGSVRHKVYRRIADLRHGLDLAQIVRQFEALQASVDGLARHPLFQVAPPSAEVDTKPQTEEVA